MRFSKGDFVDLNIKSLHHTLKGPFEILKVEVNEKDTSQPYYTLKRRFPHFFNNNYPIYFENTPHQLLEERPFGLAKFNTGDIVKWDQDIRNGHIKVPYVIWKMDYNKTDGKLQYHLSKVYASKPFANEETDKDTFQPKYTTIDESSAKMMYKVPKFETKFVPGCYMKIKGMSDYFQNCFRICDIVESIDEGTEQHYLISSYSDTSNKTPPLLIRESMLEGFNFETELIQPFHLIDRSI